MNTSEKLRKLADWFDIKYGDAGVNDQVQRDLRLWANQFEQLQAVCYEMIDILKLLHYRKDFIERWEKILK